MPEDSERGEPPEDSVQAEVRGEVVCEVVGVFAERLDVRYMEWCEERCRKRRVDWCGRRHAVGREEKVRVPCDLIGKQTACTAPRSLSGYKQWATVNSWWIPQIFGLA